MRVLVTASLALVLGAPSPSQKVAPTKGVFLVAKPSISSGPFHKSVVLLLSHGDDGTLGVIVNRATGIPLAEALPDLDASGAAAHTLHFGGPVALQGLIFLFRSDEPPKGVDGVMGNVYFSSNPEVLDALIEEERGPEELRLYLGHSGWAPGQLDNELLRGDWDVVRADAFTLFRKKTETMWDELAKSQRVIARSSRPSRPSLRSARDEAR